MISALNSIISKATDLGMIVGTSVLVAQQGKIIFEKNAGFSDREAKEKVNNETVFRLASMTKPIVSMATLALAEKQIIVMWSN